MNEIEKMYKNAGIEPIKQGYCGWDCDCPFSDVIHNKCGDDCPYWKYEDEAKYLSFTAEKQIKLIELFISSIWWENLKSLYRIIDDSLSFADKLAKIVNYLWISLSDEEKKQIKDILDETEKA